MKKKWKYRFALFLACGILAGCGKSENKDSSTGEDSRQEAEGYGYVAEIEALADSHWISGVCGTEEKVYITTYGDEDFENHAISIDLTTREKHSLNLPLEEDGSSMVNSIAMDPDGNLVFFEKNEEEENIFYYIKTCSPDKGELISSLDITALFDETEFVFVGELEVDKEHRFYLDVNDYILAVSEQGQELFRIDFGMGGITGLRGMTSDADGDIIFLGITSGMRDRMTPGIIDPEQKGEVHYYDKIEGDIAAGRIARGKAGEFYVSNNGSVYVFDKEKEEMAEEVFAWKDCYISNSRKVRFFSPVGEDGFFAILTEQMGLDAPYSSHLVWLEKTPQSEIAPRKTLTLGTFENNVNIQAYVDYFNSVNTKYWIEVKTYCLDFTDQALAQEARIQMMLDLVSGNGPDLMETSFLDFNLLATKGIVEDLYPYLEEDPDLKDVEFFPSVLDACSVDGKLYCIPDSFSFDILIGREEDCKGLSGMTPEELFAFGEQYAGARRLVEYDKNNLLAVLFGSMFSEFVDWNSGECRFDSEEFIRLLEFVNRFGMSAEEAEAVWNLPEDMDQEYVLERMDINNVLDYKAMELRVGNPVVLVGYPVNENEGGNGALLSFHPRFEICSFSENKEGAWEFIRCFLLPEYYESALEASPEYMQFPTRRDIYERAFEKWMETEETGETEESGEIEETGETEETEEKEETENVDGEGGEKRVRGVYEYTDYDGRRAAEPVTKEDKDAVTKIIENITVSRRTWNEDILIILEEEAAPFFAGQKSAKEAADIIQSRVQLYVRENM